MSKILFFDLETTGTNHYENGVHQISGIIDIDGEVKDTFDIKLQPFPNAVIVDKALIVGHINRDILATYQSFNSGYNELVGIIGKYVDKYNKKDKMYLAGYNNAAFDNSFLRAIFEKNFNKYFGAYFFPNPLDVYVLATPKIMDVQPEMENVQLATVCQQMGIEIDESKLHDALYDVTLTRELYYKVIS